MINTTMNSEKISRPNRVKETLGKIYEEYPPYFREYLRRYNEDPTSRVFAPLAEAYRRMGRVDEAIEVCLEGLVRHPDFHGGRLALAKCYLDKRALDKARMELDRVVQFTPENLLAQKLLAETCLELGDKQAGLHAYKMALMLSPQDVVLAEKIRVIEQQLGEDSSLGEQQNIATAKSQEVEPALPNDKGTCDLTPKDGLASNQSNADAEIPPMWMEVETKEAGELQLSSDLKEQEGNKDEMELKALLSDEGEVDDSFKIEHVSAVFSADKKKEKKEITTETLGDLYFSQGQFDKALQIFEKLSERTLSRELEKKINLTRARLGVDPNSMLRNRQIAVLRSLLKALQSKSSNQDSA